MCQGKDLCQLFYVSKIVCEMILMYSIDQLFISITLQVANKATFVLNKSIDTAKD